MPLTQRERTLSVSTPLGGDALLLRAMTGRERLGALFNYDLELLSEDLDVRHEDLLGRAVTVRVELGDGRKRYFNGIVNRFAQVGFDGAFALYRANLVPWAWFLTRTADCRIFQDKTVPGIIKEIFREHGLTDFEESLTGSYRRWAYCVQYRETDFSFISRLMEREGIYYYFKHQHGKHILVLADDCGAHDASPGYEEIPYYPPDEEALRERDHISEWSLVHQVRSGAFAHTDFDFAAPKKNLYARLSIAKSHELSGFEIYDYPGGYLESADGEAYARIRLEEIQAAYETVRAAGNARGLSTGALFQLTNYPREDQNRQYLIVSASYRLQSDLFASSGTPPSNPVFQCSFTAMDADTPYRPPRITPKPVVQGPQTAVVVGKAGEEIWTDKYGRVKVLFHWDREGKADERSSCWIRVAQTWAGKHWGGIHVPRIGQEVIVDFLEGDPDCPIVVGRVYNGECMPPYLLPDHATVSTLKSSSSNGGRGFNEIRLEDRKGAEQLFVHAERNQDVRVKNDSFEWVGNEHHVIVAADRLEQVDGDRHLTVGGDSSTKVDGTVSLDAGMDFQQQVGVRHALDAGTEVHIKAGMNVIIEAGSSITLKAGGGFVVVGPAGVAISGTPVLINSGGAPGVGSGCFPETPKIPMEAATAEPGSKATVQPRSRVRPAPPRGKGCESPQAQAFVRAAESGAPFCERCEELRRAREQRRETDHHSPR